MLQLSSDVYTGIHPNVINSADAIDAYTDRLIGYASAMVAAEAQRRQPTHFSSLPNPAAV